MAEKRTIDQLEGDVQDNLTLDVVKSSNKLNQTNNSNNDIINNNTIATNGDIVPDKRDSVLNLKWSSRVQLTIQLDKHCKCYYLKNIDEKKKQEMIDENFAIIKTLMNLPDTTYDLKPQQNPNKRLKTISNNNVNDEIILLLPWSTRELIISTLSENHHSIFYFEFQSKNYKLQMYKRNYDLIQKLNALIVKETNTTNDEHHDANLDNSIITNGLNGSMIVNSSLKGDSSLFMEFQTIKNQLNEMRGQMNNYGPTALLSPSETTFHTLIPIEELIDGRIFLSEAYKFRGAEWTVKAAIKEICEESDDDDMDNKIDYLSVHLVLNTSGLKFEVDVDFLLINHDDSRKNITNQVSASYSKPASKGLSDLITIDELKQPGNGFIEDGMISLDVVIKVLNTSTTN